MERFNCLPPKIQPQSNALTFGSMRASSKEG
jgi:hypothetical protein